MADMPADLREVVEAQAPLRREPSPDAPLDTEALKGERVWINQTTPEGWCHGTLVDDGYAGWLPANALDPPGDAPTHKVAVPRTFVFPGPSIKLPPAQALSFGCRLTIVRSAGEFAVTASGAHVPARHLAPIDAFVEDPVAVAEMFLNVPYLWGGKTSLGLDCSGLVQIAHAACGIACPRDSNMQAAALGRAVPMHGATCDVSVLRRGDLLFWKGHVAMVRDRDTLIHANAFHMAVAIEPIIDALARIAAAGTAFAGVRRVLAETADAL